MSRIKNKAAYAVKNEPVAKDTVVANDSQNNDKTVLIEVGSITSGINGADGDSAYEVAVANGFVGTEQEWLDSLQGTNGTDGSDGVNGTDGTDGINGTDGSDGSDGDSAYEVAVANGFVGSESAWLTSLEGSDGLNGTNGTDGTDGINGTDGSDGKDFGVLIADGIDLIVSSFTVNINEIDVSIPETIITMFPNETKFIGIDLVDYTIHVLRRNYQDGMIWLGKVTTDATQITSLENYPIELPVDKIHNFKSKLIGGLKSVRIALLGDSLVEGGAGGGVSWSDKLFDIAQGGYGYNIPSLAGIGDVDNYGTGGQTSHHGMLWTGKAVRSGTGGFVNTGINYDNISQAEKFDYTDLKVLRNSPLFENDYDLVIIGFGANGGTYKMGYLENVVKLIREKGIDVIVCTQNFRAGGGETTNETYYDEGIIIKRICDAYGAALADSWSFLKEVSQSGTAVLFDDIHPNDEGKTAYANSFRTIINDVTLPKLYNYVSDNRIIKNPDQSHTAKDFINYSEIDCHPSSITGTMIASAIPDFKNPAVQYAGLDPTLSVIELEVGEYANFATSHGTAFSVIYDASMVGDFDVFTQNGGNLVGSFSQASFTGNSPKLAEITNMIGAGTHIGSKGVRVTCTSGTCKIYGIMWHVYKNKTISLDDIKTRGTWLEESWSYSHPRSVYTDTLDDSVSFKFNGSACLLHLSRKSAGGIVDIYLNGELYQEDLDLYSAGTFLSLQHITSAKDEFYDTVPQENTVTVRLKGVNGSAIAPSSGNRRLGILNIMELDKR